MAINIFLFLDCLGLVFLMYALVNFWQEWRRTKSGRHSPIQVDEHNFGVSIATFPAVHTSNVQNSVIPFPARHRQTHLSPEHQKGFAKPIEMQRRLESEPRVSQGGK
jgi:hypothetical protein